ncbi:MAG: hypothetical protein PWP23_2299 [Candidatus Sumerlaeota bacterium]|nr:hypothetical protein [Candidatus Sumerlaeota bacterium]
MLEEELTRRIIKCCIDVSNELGAGFMEGVYHSALLFCLQDEGLVVESERPLDVYFRDRLVGRFFADLVVEEKIILELKAVDTILPAHTAQLLNYLRATELKIGLLVNFGTPRVQWKRLVC